MTTAVTAQPANIRIAPYKHNAQCAISYTFDDGMMEHYTLVAPLFEELGWRATFAINGRRIDRARWHQDTTTMTWDEVKQLHLRGHEIANHGWAHRKLTRISPEEAQREIERNDSAILVHTQAFPATFIYPFNAKDSLIITMAEYRRVASRTHQTAVGGKSSPEKLQRWVKQLLVRKAWGVGMTHGITYGYDAFDNYEQFKTHLLAVQEMGPTVWVAPFGEVAKYLAHLQQTTLTCQYSRKEWRIRLNTDLDAAQYNTPLTLLLENITFCPKVQQGRRKLAVFPMNGGYRVDIDPFGGEIRVSGQ